MKTTSNIQYIKKTSHGDYYYSDKEMTIYHRDDGPAIIESVDGEDSGNFWYLNGRLHRDNGPAVMMHDGYNAWYLNGEHLAGVFSQEGFTKYKLQSKINININGKLFTVKELEKLIKAAKLAYTGTLV